MKRTTRTFIAVDLNADVRRRASKLIDRLRPVAPMVKWVSSATLHLTLKFLGDVSDQDLYTVCKRVREISERRRCFRISCQGLGAFPKPKRPRVFWVGVEEQTGELLRLQEEIEQAMGELGFIQELRPYQAHITIGRIPHRGYRPINLEELKRQVSTDQLWLGESDVSETIVYSSDLGASGPEYTTMARAALQI